MKGPFQRFTHIPAGLVDFPTRRGGMSVCSLRLVEGRHLREKGPGEAARSSFFQHKQQDMPAISTYILCHVYRASTIHLGIL